MKDEKNEIDAWLKKNKPNVAKPGESGKPKNDKWRFVPEEKRTKRKKK